MKIIQNSRRDLLGSFYQVQNNLKRVSSQPRNEATIDELLNSLSIISNEIRQLSNTAENNLKPIVEKNENIGNTETEVVSSTKSYDKSVESANKDEVLDDDLRKQIDRLYSISHEKYISIFRTKLKHKNLYFSTFILFYLFLFQGLYQKLYFQLRHEHIL